MDKELDVAKLEVPSIGGILVEGVGLLTKDEALIMGNDE